MVQKKAGNPLWSNYYHNFHFVIIQSLSPIQLFATPWTATHQASLSFTISWSSIESVMLSNHLVLCHPLLLWPSIFPSIRVFSNELAVCIKWPKHWSFSISHSNEYSGLIKIDSFDLLAVKGTLSLKASILQCSVFFMVQLSHLDMTNGQQGDPTSPSWRRSVLGVHWRDWCWSWNSSTLATSWEELTHWKRPWCWEGLGARGEGDDRGWNGWMASPTWWTWVWVDHRSWWWTGRTGVLQSMGLQSRTWLSDWTELSWMDKP